MAEGVYALIGEAIRGRRDAIGMTQAALGRRVGLSRSSVTNIELGRQHVAVHHLLLIAEALDVAVPSLLPARAPAPTSPPEALVPEFRDLLLRLGSSAPGASS